MAGYQRSYSWRKLPPHGKEKILTARDERFGKVKILVTPEDSSKYEKAVVRNGTFFEAKVGKKRVLKYPRLTGLVFPSWKSRREMRSRRITQVETIIKELKKANVPMAQLKGRVLREPETPEEKRAFSLTGRKPTSEFIFETAKSVTVKDLVGRVDELANIIAKIRNKTKCDLEICTDTLGLVEDKNKNPRLVLIDLYPNKLFGPRPQGLDLKIRALVRDVRNELGEKKAREFREELINALARRVVK